MKNFYEIYNHVMQEIYFISTPTYLYPRHRLPIGDNTLFPCKLVNKKYLRFWRANRVVRVASIQYVFCR